MQVYVRDEVLTNTKAMQMSVEVLIQVPGRSIDLKRGSSTITQSIVLEVRVQNVREEEKVETPDPFVRTDFKDGRVALMNESRWFNAEDGDSSGLMLTLVALHIF
ncbi:uncharacterized protein MONOS_16317 [Monocercomonoides exilis]|uniref:uncharacterized protein n=1 Tax=Monocercomonoides exilis TaxID=2049356 RepID=UPI003559A1E5|nr:hypothetical protein MONOS_16317 [Monocercomonoides exilis]|eukprot:MONOS_16317.1-p1 / transcript=MONOS_16317.1 / gene=MONOS_16317 / organism=Monocercomonoides_exilis_PA203 / gene_product=unspecified product / transcript_product=unspecified product / location=Mono_scaffold01641:6721-7258(-) / protein_length=105 / sequence_SO=supercontig / SO=protein_coding / is_pseudo=false